jgi:hypothetical protein
MPKRDGLLKTTGVIIAIVVGIATMWQIVENLNSKRITQLTHEYTTRITQLNQDHELFIRNIKEQCQSEKNRKIDLVKMLETKNSFLQDDIKKYESLANVSDDRIKSQLAESMKEVRRLKTSILELKHELTIIASRNDSTIVSKKEAAAQPHNPKKQIKGEFQSFSSE